MDNIAKLFLAGAILFIGLMTLFSSNFTRTDTTRESGMTYTAPESPTIDLIRPQQTGTAVFALG